MVQGAQTPNNHPHMNDNDDDDDDDDENNANNKKTAGGSDRVSQEDPFPASSPSKVIGSSGVSSRPWGSIPIRPPGWLRFTPGSRSVCE